MCQKCANPCLVPNYNTSNHLTFTPQCAAIAFSVIHHISFSFFLPNKCPSYSAGATLMPLSSISLPPPSSPLTASKSPFIWSGTKQGLDLIDLRLTWRKMEKLSFEDFWRHSWGFLEIFWGILEKFARCEKKIKNFHQSETNKVNEVLRPLRLPNSLGGQI